MQKSHSDLIPDFMGSLVGFMYPLGGIKSGVNLLPVRAVVHGSEKGHDRSFHIRI